MQSRGAGEVPATANNLSQVARNKPPLGAIAAPATGALLMAVVSLVDFWRHMFNQGTGTYQKDIRIHAAIAQAIFGGSDSLFRPGAFRETRFPAYLTPGDLPPHPGLHIATRLIALLTPMDIRHSMVWLLVVAVVATFVLTYFMLRSFTDLSPWPASLLAVVLGVVSAIWLPAFSKNIFFGQGTPNIWHNPTQVLLVPFALGTVWIAMLWLDHPSTKKLVAIGALTAVSSIVKPSFALIFIPALLCLIAVEALQRHDFTQLRNLILALIPVGVVILVQFAADDSGNGGGIKIDPFFLVRRGTPNWGVSILLALAFPLSVLVVFPRALRDRRVQLAWLMTITGYLQRLLLLEAKRPLHGNWSWSYFIALKILFVVSAIAIFRCKSRRTTWVLLPLAVLAFHLLSGTVYLDHLITGKGFV